MDICSDCNEWIGDCTCSNIRTYKKRSSEDLAKESAYTDKTIKKILEIAKKNKQIEREAQITHDIWSHWMRYFLTNREKFTQEDYDRWEKQSQTPYNELSEIEKQSDRDVAKQYFQIKD